MEENKTQVQPKQHKKSFWGYLFIVLGVFILFKKIFDISFFDWIAWEYLWPTLLIVLGMYFVIKKNK